MEVSKVLTELRAERALLDEVIAKLEMLSTGHKKRGRPRGRHVTVTSLPGGGPFDEGEPADRSCAARQA